MQRILKITNRRTKQNIIFDLSDISNEYRRLINRDESNDLETIEHALFEIGNIHGAFKFEIKDTVYSKKCINEYDSTPTGEKK